jgi:hypothetical protein
MYSTSKWAVEPVQVPELVEFPRMLLWKLTVLLGMVGIGIGLGTGYLLGRSTVGTPQVVQVPRRPIRMRILPTGDMDPAETIKANKDSEVWMPPTADSPPGSFTENFPPQGKTPALIPLENRSSRNSDRG